MKFLRNTELMLLIGVALSFIVPWPAEKLKILIVPELILIMTFSLGGLSFPKLSRKNISYSWKMLLLNFVFYSGILLLSSLLVKNINYKIGFIMMAAAPPAIMVVPLSKILGGNMKEAVFSEIACYVVALVYMPAIAYLFLREYVSIISLLKILFLFIIIPLIFSRFLHRAKIKYDFKEVINLLFVFGMYIGLALANSHIMQNPFAIIPLLFIVAIPKFLTGFGIKWLSKLEHIKKQDEIPALLFSTFKNGNLVVATCLLLFEPETILPTVMASLIAPFYVFFMLKLFKITEK